MVSTVVLCQYCQDVALTIVSWYRGGSTQLHVSWIIVTCKSHGISMGRILCFMCKPYASIKDYKILEAYTCIIYIGPLSPHDYVCERII